MTKASWVAVVLSMVLALSACGDDAPKRVDLEVARDGGGPDAPGAASDGGTGGRPPGPGGAACAAQACSGRVADFCCPAACGAATDVDCPGCGNGVLEPGETCEGPSCPKSCEPDRCQRRRLKGAGTCSAVCADDGLQTACVSGDGCCPAACNAGEDADCAAVCGNGVVEPGEACDPKVKDGGAPGGASAGCPTACPTAGCARFELRGAGTCQATCAEVGKETACRSGDGCCPAGCTGTNDADCAQCGNGVKEPTESCDPQAPGGCPTACPAQGCQLRRLVNPGSCNAQCLDDRLQSACQAGDGCCPPTCDATTDGDCAPKCGNRVVEAGETCDPPSACEARQSACVGDATTVRTAAGDVGACTFRCAESPRACGPADGFCPGAGCGPTRDPDCAGCGNGKLEAGESCDPPTVCAMRQAACASDATTVRTSAGDPAACTFTCAEMARACSLTADAVCPPGCTFANDFDCKKAAGQACMQKDECRTALCQDARCCAQACGTCQACTGAGGACVQVAGEDDPDSCTGASTCDAKGACVPKTTLTIAPATHDFGDVFVGGSGGTRLTVRNAASAPTTGPVTVTASPAAFVIVSDGCGGKPLEGGGACTVSVSFRPTAAGAATGTLRATASPGGTVDAALQGTGRPPVLTLSPSPVAIGTVTVGQQGSLLVTVTNPTQKAEGPLSLSLAGMHPNEFLLGAGGEFGTNTCEGATLEAGATCQVQVYAAPRTPAGKSVVLTVAAKSGATGSATVTALGVTGIRPPVVGTGTTAP